MDDQPIVWLVGVKKGEAKEYRQLLEASGRLLIETASLQPTAEGYVDLAVEPATGAVLIGDGLRKRTNHAYSHTEVAAFLRPLRPELPIFLIADADAPGDDGTLDAVFDARDLRRRPEVYVSRLLRASGRYQGALTARQRRIQHLLDRQSANGLSEPEVTELAALRAEYERPAQVKLAKSVASRELDLAEQRGLVEQLAAIADRLERSRNGSG